MRQFTRQQLSEAADLEEGFCIRCGEQQSPAIDQIGQLGLCENCGAQAVIPAATVLQVAGLIAEED